MCAQAHTQQLATLANMRKEGQVHEEPQPASPIFNLPPGQQRKATVVEGKAKEDAGWGDAELGASLAPSHTLLKFCLTSGKHASSLATEQQSTTRSSSIHNFT